MKGAALTLAMLLTLGTFVALLVALGMSLVNHSIEPYQSPEPR